MRIHQQDYYDSETCMCSSNLDLENILYTHIELQLITYYAHNNKIEIILQNVQKRVFHNVSIIYDTHS